MKFTGPLWRALPRIFVRHEAVTDEAPRGFVVPDRIRRFRVRVRRRVTGVGLGCEAPNSPAPGVFDKALEQLASYSSIARRRLYEHFHQIQCFPSIFRPPPVGSVGEASTNPSFSATRITPSSGAARIRRRHAGHPVLSHAHPNCARVPQRTRTFCRGPALRRI